MLFVPIFPLLLPSTQYPHSLQQSPPFSSCPWVMHISYWASPFLILFLTPPVYSVPNSLYFLIPEPFPPFSPFPLPTDNPPNDLHI